MSEETNTLEEEAKKRKERLQSLKRKREENCDSGKPNLRDEEKISLPKPKFRSYKPQDEKLTEHMIGKANITDVRSEVKNLLDLGKGDIVIDQLDISSLAPRQPDWDLKRDVEKKLEKLARRTQKAMAELIRERLREKQDLAEIANAPVDV